MEQDPAVAGEPVAAEVWAVAEEQAAVGDLAAARDGVAAAEARDAGKGAELAPLAIPARPARVVLPDPVGPPTGRGRGKQGTRNEEDIMPWGDRSGPTGMGPRTGRAAGLCAGSDRPGAASGLAGRGGSGGRGGGFGGRGRGGGFGGGGRGWRRCFHETGLPGWMRGAFGRRTAVGPEAPVSEHDALKQQAEALQAQLDAVKKRLNEVGSDAAGERETPRRDPEGA